jgi:proline iminopeptidase
VAGCRAYWAILSRGYFVNPRVPSPMKGDWCAGGAASVLNLNTVNAATFTSLGQWDWRADAARILVPVLIIHGTDDPLPLQGSREWVDAFPDARLVTIANAGHYPFVDHPDEVFAAIARFVSESPAPRR